MSSKQKYRKPKEVTSFKKGYTFLALLLLIQCPSYGYADENNICEGAVFGAAFEDPTDCLSYYECMFGETNHKTCPAGERFDKNYGGCIVGKCPPCNTETTTTTSTTTTTEAPSTPSTEADTTTPSSTTSTTTTPTTTSTTTTTPTTTSTTTTTPTTTSTTTTPTTTSTTTTPTTTSTTTTPTTTSTTTTSTSSPVIDCSPYCQPSEHGTMHRDRSDCKKFYICRNGVANAQYCKYGMYFDEVINACNFAALVSCTPSSNENCPTETTTPSTTSTTTSTTTTTPTTTSTTTTTPTTTSTTPTTTSTTTTTPTTTSTTTTTPTTTSTTTTPTTTSTTTTPTSTTTTTTSSPDCSPYCQPSEHGTMHRDRSDCTKFYICRNGVANALYCKYGMYFDEVINACNFAALVSCTPSSSENCPTETTTPSTTSTTTSTTTPTTTSTTKTTPTTTSTTTTTPTSTSTTTTTPTTTSTTTTTPTTTSTTTPTPTTTSTTTPTTTSTITTPDCSSGSYCQPSEHGTFHRDRNDCRKYYVCRNGEAVVHYCNDGMYFDDIHYVCNFASLVQCTPNNNNGCPTNQRSASSQQICRTVPDCKANQNGFVQRDETDCAKFYFCRNGIAYTRSCRNGESFDLSINACKPSNQVQCTPNKNCLLP